MDSLVRIRLRPLGVWSTPWQADSLMGALANVWARSNGDGAIVRDFLEPWLSGSPAFVISDAFPGDLLPSPAGLPIWWEWPQEDYKRIKRRELLSPGEFGLAQRGMRPELEDESGRVFIEDHARLRNSISRVTDTTGEGGELFEVPFSVLARRGDPRDESELFLTLYARTDSAGLEVLISALEMLGQTGYGADASVGHGGFEVADGPEPCPELDDVPGADSFISLSTFQPTPSDPVDGLWRVFIKYGKLAPEFQDVSIFKRPQAMLQPGACFRTQGPPLPYYGGAITSDRLLTERDRSALEERGIRPAQAAFALAVPMVWPGADW